jgi:hypothetical protein
MQRGWKFLSQQFPVTRVWITALPSRVQPEKESTTKDAPTQTCRFSQSPP